MSTHKKSHFGGRGGRHREHKQESKAAASTSNKASSVACDESCPIIKAFRGYQKEMDAKNDRYERIMKLNRDITVDSKRLIFLLQRINSSGDRDSVLAEANEKMKELHSTKFKALAKELEGHEIHQYLKACTGGLQEYIEAVLFYHYLSKDTLATMDCVQPQLVFPFEAHTDSNETATSTCEFRGKEKESKSTKTEEELTNTPSELGKSQKPGSTVNELNKPEMSYKHSSAMDSGGHVCLDSQRTVRVQLLPSEYMLGLADFAGELMRMAINSVGAGDLETPKVIANMMRVLHDAFSTLSNTTREMRWKTTVMRQSLAKVERACYTLKVRGSEIPNHMLTDVFSSFTGPSDSFMSEETETHFD